MTTQPAASNDRPETILDPVNEMRVAKCYDIDSGYLIHHINSIEGSRNVQRPALTKLLTRGYEVVPALDVAVTEHLVNVMKQAPMNPLPAVHLGRAGLKSLLEMVLQGQLERRIQSTLLSNYAVIFADLFTAEPGYESWSSFWHCDAGPESHVKVIVYLNSSTEHDGATECLDVDITRLFKKVGYAFGPLGNRQPDLDGIAGTFGIPYKPDILRPETGHAIVFHPSQVLHKALSPTRGIRHTLNLGIIPSVPDWGTFYDTSFQLLESNTGGAFPDLN